jgi:hypothetical protein
VTPGQPLAGRLSVANGTPSGTSMLADQASALGPALGFPTANAGTSTGADAGAANPMFESHPFNMITVKHLERLLGGELMALGPTSGAPGQGRARLPGRPAEPPEPRGSQPSPTVGNALRRGLRHVANPSSVSTKGSAPRPR